MNPAAAVARRMLKLSMSKFDPGRLGLHQGEAQTQARLRRVIEVFVEGYNEALLADDLELACRAVDTRFDDHHRGFAYEGIGMLLAVKDLFSPRCGNRLATFCGGAGRPHHYIAAVGAGFAVARVPFARGRLPAYLGTLPARDRWCVYDGYGFHQAVFHKKKYVERQHVPGWLPPEAMQPFYGGVGRSLWWVEGAEPARIAATIARFPADHRDDMWHGIGIATSYAGGVSMADAERLRELAGPSRDSFLAGIPYAVQMRVEGGNLSPWTEALAKRFLGRSPATVAEVTEGILDSAEAEIAGRGGDVGREIYGQTLGLLRGAARGSGANSLGAPKTGPLRETGREL